MDTRKHPSPPSNGVTSICLRAQVTPTTFKGHSFERHTSPRLVYCRRSTENHCHLEVYQLTTSGNQEAQRQQQPQPIPSRHAWHWCRAVLCAKGCSGSGAGWVVITISSHISHSDGNWDLEEESRSKILMITHTVCASSHGHVKALRQLRVSSLRWQQSRSEWLT